MMTPEQRFDRLERIVKLMIEAGLRARRQSHEQDEKINILIATQMRNDDLFAKNAEQFAKHEALFARNDELFARNDERFRVLAEGLTRTDRRLDSLTGFNDGREQSSN